MCTMTILDQMQKRGRADFMKDLAEAVLQRLMEFDVERRIEAARCDRSEKRTAPSFRRTIWPCELAASLRHPEHSP